jgi:hypothetical protein
MVLPLPPDSNPKLLPTNKNNKLKKTAFLLKTLHETHGKLKHLSGERGAHARKIRCLGPGEAININ